MADGQQIARRILDAWPAVVVPVVLVVAVALVAEGRAQSRQLVALRHDLGMMSSEIGQLKQEISLLRMSSEARSAPRSKAPRPADPGAAEAPASAPAPRKGRKRRTGRTE